MGLLELTREILSVPVALARPMAGLVTDAARAVVHRSLPRPTTHRLNRTGADLSHRARRAWTTRGRTHLELREVEEALTPAYLAGTVEALSEMEEVQSARAVPDLGRVVVEHDDELAVTELAHMLDQVEHELMLDDRPFGRHRPDHPADGEPITESLVAIGADIGGLGLAAGSRALRLPRLPFETDTAALLTVASYVPGIRDRLEARTENPAFQTAMAVSRSLSAGLNQSVAGPVIDVLHRSSGLVAAVARHRAWQRLEPELVGWHVEDHSGLLIPPIRPATMPRGPIERTATPVTIASAGAAAVGLVVRPDFDRAVSFLVAGTPKASKWGREAFAAHLGIGLAGRNILVCDPGCLEQLDRIDTLILDSDLAFPEPGVRAEPGPFVPEVIAAARAAGVDVFIAGREPSRLARLDIAGVVETGAATIEVVRRMQDEGRGVAVVAVGPHPALRFADVGLGLRAPDRGVPWGASLIGGEGLVDGYLLMLAIDAAKTAARQSANVAVAGAGVAGLMSFGTIIPGTLPRVMATIDLASLIAHANGARLGISAARQSVPAPPDLRPFHAMDGELVLEMMGGSPEGLETAEAARRLDPPPPRTPGVVAFTKAVTDELVNPLTPFLAAGAGLSAAAGSMSDAVLVGGVVGLNALLGGVQRFRADRATAALMAREQAQTSVVRDGHLVRLSTDQLVPGDLISLEAGEVIPADCRIIHSVALEVDESSLTGESLPAYKHADPCPVTAPVADRHSMLFAGTTVAAGSALGVAVAVGRRTEAYRGLLLSGNSGAPTGGVEARLESLTSMVTPAAILAGLGVLGSGVARSRPLVDVLSSGVSLAVAAVPEGLPLLATAAQQAAARRLAGKGVIVRNARAIEALGRVNVVCADKTGTLTLGRIRVAVVSDGRSDETPTTLSPAGRRVLVAARAATPDPEGDRRLPHPTDRAIVYAVEEGKVHRREEFGVWIVTDELPFEPRRGYHATRGLDDEGARLTVKGAPEVVIPLCARRLGKKGSPKDLSDKRRQAMLARIEEFASRGLRILVIAERRLDREVPLTEAAVEDLTLLGFLGLKDPVRESSAGAVAQLRDAGVRVIMITGDHPTTARGIATELGLGGRGGILTGPQIEALSDADLAEALADIDVCARVTPAHKVRVVRALRAHGEVVGMTGDGANDAPAIRLADVGIALGTRATDAARDASDLIVTDDRIETIVEAVVEGRALWASVRDATALLVGGNLGEIAFTLAGSVLTGTSPINTRQLLLVNLMTDVLPAMAIAVSRPPDRSPAQLLHEGPEESLGEVLNRAILLRAGATTIGTTAGWAAARLTGRSRRASTVALASLVGAELGQTMATRWRSPLVVGSSVGSAALMAGIIQTPGLSQVFGCTPLGPLGWLQASGGATLATVGAVVAPRLLDRMGDTD